MSKCLPQCDLRHFDAELFVVVVALVHLLRLPDDCIRVGDVGCEWFAAAAAFGGRFSARKQHVIRGL